MVASFNLPDPQWTLMVCSVTALSVTALQVITAANEVWGKVIFSKTYVKNSVHRGRVYLSACWDTHPPGADTPPEADTPWEQTPPPGADTPLGADTPQEQTPSRTEHAGRYGQCAGGTHPTGMQSCFVLF